MRDLGRVVAQIPARGGSKRVPAKNLRLLRGRPLIAYAIECAQASARFDEVWVNTDSDAIAAAAKACGALVHRRPEHLGSDTASGDDFNAEFIEVRRPDTLVMVNPVCPLLLPEDVAAALDAFAAADCDTLISCEETRLQTFCAGEAVNIDPTGPLAPTQVNPPVQVLNWAITVWEPASFLERYRAGAGAYIGHRRLLHPLDPTRTLKISVEADFRLAALLVEARALIADDGPARYWSPGDPVG